MTHLRPIEPGSRQRARLRFPPRSRALTALVMLLAALAPRLAEAADLPAPSQRLASDATPAAPAWSLSVDPLGVAFGAYGLGLERCFASHHGVWLSAAWEAEAGPSALSLGLGYRLHPLGRGVEGLLLGLSFEAALRAAPATPRLELGLEGGYQAVWRGLLLGLTLGVEHQIAPPPQTSPWALRVRLALGWAWR
ncbi:MAG: hypothetical protein OEY14_13665 [Myxococcales bacterium]|nr:hypothetical protein [Myxococcales bacterium]